MRLEKAHLLPLVVGTTLGLLIMAAVLVVVGIFNETLRWDLFGPRLEAALWGVFSSCLALAAIGVAMTLVVGTRSIARSFERLERGVTGRPAVTEVAPRRTLRYTFTLAAGLALLVAALSATDRAILHHRSSVFKRLASEQVLRFGDRLQPLARIPPRGFGPREMERIDLALRSLLNLPFVNRVIVYRLDPNDAGAFLYYEAFPTDRREGKHFTPRLAVKATERELTRALRGADGALDWLNSEQHWHWYHLVVDEHDHPTALVEFVGNPRENYREYLLGG